MDALIFVIDSVLTFLVYAFLLRVLLPLVRADFRNPLSQAILALTSWLVHPLRRVLPPVGRLDTASVVALLAVQVVATLVLFRLQAGVVPPLVPLVLAALRSLVLSVLLLYTVLIFIYALLSFVAPGVRSPATALLASLCEPLLMPLRRMLPIVGGLDFSPLVAIVALQALRLLIT
ncbi:MAG TPA: YggT family protein [Steroidobacteraceae bacterium]|nr:YggT family protein [Steroidobacteraceae bacterium]